MNLTRVGIPLSGIYRPYMISVGSEQIPGNPADATGKLYLAYNLVHRNGAWTATPASAVITGWPAESSTYLQMVAPSKDTVMYVEGTAL